MDKVLNFLDKWGVLILICLSVLTLINQCSNKSAVKKSNKIFKEYVAQESRQDSIFNISLNSYLYNIEHKLDSTLISNSAVVNANKATSSAIKESSQKQQQVVVKVVPQTIETKQ